MKKWGVYIAAVAGFAIYGAVTDVDRDESGAIIGAGQLDAFDINVGDCFDDANYTSEEISSVAGVPCSEPHDNEVYAAFEIPGSTFPGEEAVDEIAYNTCMEKFEPFVGLEYESSTLDVTFMYPTEESWAQNDHEVICAVYDIEANKLVGSVAGRGL